MPVRIVRFFAMSGIVLVLLFAGLVGFTETQMFRSLARDFIVESVDSSLYATLEIGEIEGNIFSGWKISDVRLNGATGPIVFVPSLTVRYNIFTIPWKRIEISEVTLYAPRISVTRGFSGKWNIEGLVRDTSSTPSEGGAFDWRIILRNLSIVSAQVVVWDSTTSFAATESVFDTRHMFIGNMDIDMEADIAPALKRLSIDNISFRNFTNGVSLQSLSGDIEVGRTGAAVSGLAVRTDRSNFLLTAHFTGADPLSDTAFTNLAQREFGVDLTAPAVDTRDIQYFLPSLSFLGDAPALRLSASGSLRHLTIPVLEIRARETALTMRGELRDIDRGADLRLDVMLDGSVVQGRDINTLVPGFGLPDYSGIGTATFRTLRYNGTPLAFHAELDLESDAGAVSGTADMDINKPEIEYAYDITTRGLDLARLLQMPLLSSSLTLRAALRGRGFTPGRMFADAVVTADTSRYQRYRTDSLAATLTVRPDTLRFDARTALGRSTLAVGAALRFTGDSVMAFHLDLDARALDLAMALDDDKLASNLTFHLNADGNGLDPSSASARAKLSMAASTFAGTAYDADTMRVELDQRDPAHRLLHVGTRYADFDARGRFDLPRFISDVSVRSDSIVSGLREYRLGVDSTAIAAALPAPPTTRARRAAGRARLPVVVPDTASYMDAKLTLRLKETDPIARHLGAELLMVHGSYEGTVRGGANRFDLDGSLKISDLYYVDTSLDAMAAGIRVDFGLNDLRRAEPLRTVKMDLRAAAQEISIGGFLASSVGLRVQMSEGIPRFQMRGRMDTTLSVLLEGSARKGDNAYDITVPSLQLVWMQREWRNAAPIRLLIDSGSIGVQSFEMDRLGTRISLAGTRSFTGANNLALHVDGLRLSDVDSLLLSAGGDFERGQFSGDAVVDVRVLGTDDAPELAAEFFVRNLAYDNMTFETFRAEATYTPSVLEVFSELNAAPRQGPRRPVFSASGSLPIHLSFGDTRDVDVLGAANLHVSMREFPLALTEKFIGLFSPLEGTANAEIDIVGNADTLAYDGVLTVNDARGRLVMNNMYYGLSLKVEPRGNTLHVRELTLRNDPDDWNRGSMTAAGTITMDGFRLAGIAMNVDGRLKVLRRESRSALKAVYGDLYVTTGTKPLRYVADENRARIEGNLDVLEGNLTYASDNGDRRDGNNLNIRYVDVDDVAKQKEASLSQSRKSGGGSLFGRSLEQRRSDSLAAARRALSTDLAYDISVSTAGVLRILMPFSANLQMELNAALNIEQLRLTSALGAGKFNGTVSLGPDSYYKMFGTQFSASGSLVFIGDPQNPDLNLRALYTDYHVDRVTGERRRVYVIITITGNRVQPNIAWDMRWDSPESQQRPRAGDVQSDAFSFILLGLFTDELTTADRGRIIDQADKIANAVASSVASSAASEFLRKAGLQSVLQRVEISGLGTQDARVKATSGIGRVLLTYDGKINNLGSGDISFEIPMGTFFPDLGIGNMIIQASRKTSTTGVETTSTGQESAVYELKLLYRFSF
ncbi:MAG: translocation/assembly module TamB domain-containing protein [Ignavibacteriae bacterium]|nr:translocation/assembly module TamB domain-containing protein [Ignavibacteriota bacterium]